VFLLLRPQSKCQASVRAFESQNLPAVACGLIDTKIDQNQIALLPNKIVALESSDENQVYIIVTSTVAAEQCVLLKELWPASVQFFAVGASTGAILQHAGLKVIVPTEARSEGLLALPELQQLNNKLVVIMKGFGGRELLFDSLTARGANVEEWEVYKRVKLSSPKSTQDWRERQIRCIIATSGEVIQAAFEYFDHSWLTTIDWIVVSERTAQILVKLGVTQIQVSHDASDQALIHCAKQYMTSTIHSSEY
jgi:uroporphyrinogen-III synthase